MNRHATPQDVARVLARHGPRELASVMEPAVGSGDLLKRSGRLATQGQESFVLTWTRTNYEGVCAVQRGSSCEAEFVNDDFLEWCKNTALRNGGRLTASS